MKRAITLFLTLVMVLSLAACGNKPENDSVSVSDDTSQSQPPETDKTEFEPVPLGDFSAQDFDGNTVTKDIFADHDLTMVNLWTTTCGYCIEEMPVLNDLRKEFQDKGVRFNIISVCMDIGSTEEINDANLKKAKEIIEKAGVEYPNLIPDSVLLEGRLNGIQAFPVLVLHSLIKRNTTAILLGQHQKLRCGFIGAVMFLGTFLDRRLVRLTGLIVEPCNPTHSLVLIHIFKGTSLLLHPAG